MSKQATERESRHMGRIADMGCVLCRYLGFGHTHAHVHHLREGQGMGQRSSNYLTIPLCPEHHQGATGIHGMGTKAFERLYKLNELDLLAMTIELLSERRG